MPHHRLDDLIDYYQIKSRGLHRSLNDCDKTILLYNELKKEALKKYGDIKSFRMACKPKSYSIDVDSIKAENSIFDESHPLYGKVCAFTGTLERMPRREAMQIVANLGGINANSVTKKTNF